MEVSFSVLFKLYTQDLTSHTRPDRHVPYPLISLCNMNGPIWTVMQSGKERKGKLPLSLSNDLSDHFD